MYELKKNRKIFTSKFVGTGSSSYEKKFLPSRGLTEIEKHCIRGPNNLHTILQPGGHRLFSYKKPRESTVDSTTRICCYSSPSAFFALINVLYICPKPTNVMR